MATGPKKKPSKDFRVSFYVDEVYLLGLLGLWLLLFASAMIGFWGFGWVYRFTTLGLLVTALSVVGGVIAFQVILYLLVLCLRSGAAFSLDNRGLRDHASFCQVGYVLMADIRKISIKETLLGDFVIVHLNPGNRALARQSLFQRALSWWILMLSPEALVIPMGVLDVSRMNLETQFTHFAALRREAVVDGSPQRQSDPLNLSGSRFDRAPSPQKSRSGSPDEDFSSRLSAETFKDPEVSDVELTQTSIGSAAVEWQNEDSGVHASTAVIEGDSIFEDTFIPPAVDDALSEKSQLIQHIQALKSYVVQKKIDTKLCDVFSEYVTHFPHWSINQDPRIPAAVSEIRSVSNTADYEEVAFRYHQHSIRFALRKDIGPSDLGLLSVSYDEKVRVSLRVSVEIGSYEPDRIEVYHRGKWEKVFLEFYADVTGELESEELTEVDEATAQLDLEALRQNFGVKRSGDED